MTTQKPAEGKNYREGGQTPSSTSERKSTSENPSRIRKAIHRIKKLSRSGVLVALGLSFLAHEPVVHPIVEENFKRFISDPWEQWQNNQKQQQTKEHLSLTLQEAFEKDRQDVEERNKKRKERIQERAAEARAFKKFLREDENYKKISKDHIYFDIEYFSQGMEVEDIETAKEVFAMVNDSIKIADQQKPLQSELQEIAADFMPPGSHDPTKTSAVYTLKKSLGPQTQSCVARFRLMVMALAMKYPGLQDHIYMQKFGDHVRTLFEVDGKRHILDKGEVTDFPDEKTFKYKNEVMPFEVWLGIYAGIKPSEFKSRIEKYGPEKKTTAEFPRITDDLLDDSDNADLDNLGTADSWYQRGGYENNWPFTSAGDSEEGTAYFSTGSQSIAQSNEISALNSSTKKEWQAPQNTVIFEEKLTTALVEKLLGQNENLKSRIIFKNLKELDQEIAMAIVQALQESARRGQMHSLVFESLTQISKDAAMELNNGEAKIFYMEFQALKQMPTDLAEVLRFFKANMISLKRMKIFSAAAAEALAGPETKLTDFFDIKDLLPEGIPADLKIPQQGLLVQQPERRGPSLEIEGLLGLSREAGKGFGRYNGELYLVNCNVSAVAGEEIAKTIQPRITIRNPVNAEILKGLKSYHGQLNIEIVEMTDEFAEAIGQLSAIFISLTVKQLTGHQAELIALNKTGLRVMTINGPTPPAIAEILTTHRGNQLQLPNLTVLNPSIAEKFAEYNGDLDLSAIREMSNIEIARKFARRKNRTELNLESITPEVTEELIGNPNFNLRGIKHITPELIKVLAKKGGISLMALQSIDFLSAQELGKLHVDLEIALPENTDPKIVAEIAKVDGNLNINFQGDIRKNGLTIELAKALRHHRHFLTLNHGNNWSLEIYHELAKHEGKGLRIFGLFNMNLEIAKEFLNYQGKLDLTNSQTMEAGVYELLQKRKGGTEFIPIPPGP